MTTILEDAKAGRITDEMREIAKQEGVDPEFVRRGIASGRIVVPRNLNREQRIVGIGKGLRTKVNASIGTSTDIVDYDMEVEKARVAEKYGADTLMELSTGGDLDLIRRKVLDAVSLPVGNVPLYQAAIEAIRKKGAVIFMDEDDIFNTIEKHARDGISFMALHCSVNWQVLERLKKQKRYGGIVSRGGAFMIAWMMHNEKENPLYKDFDYVCEILREYDVLISLGNGMRAGAVQDANDRAQVMELIINSELADRANQLGVQAMVEGPGHIPLDQIELNVRLQKRLSNERPYYMLGPLVCDVAPGFDHIVAAIGAALSGAFGADLICYVTPAEHLGLPFPEDVKQGVIAARIAAHIADMVKYGRMERDFEMGVARKKLDWEKQFQLALFPEEARKIRDSRKPKDPTTCTMCGEYCAIKIVNQVFSP